MRTLRWLLAVSFMAGACTQGSPSAPPTAPAATSASTGTSSGTPSPAAAVLADGTPLPSGCTGPSLPSQTVTFVSSGRAWALDPATDTLSCLFPVRDPGPFAWGPQGDRVLLGGFRVHGLNADAPDLPGIAAQPATFDWGHPIGLAIVFAGATGEPDKRFMDDGRVQRLSALPPGTYLQMAYHPSGLALAFVVERDGKQAIWFSTNEGTDATRLVFGQGGTRFTSIAFSPDGQRLWWVAEHAGGYPVLHWMDLGHRSSITDVWRGSVGTFAQDLQFAPSGSLKSVNAGTVCDDRQALIIEGGAATPAMPFENRPTEALGWLDRTHLLVEAGGCASPTELYSVDAAGGQPVALVTGAELASPRTVLVDTPDTVPAPDSAAGQPPLGGVG
jgi:WD40-like Beta Propeller Repeat